MYVAEAHRVRDIVRVAKSIGSNRLLLLEESYA